MPLPTVADTVEKMDELEQVIRFVEGLDIRAIAERVMHALFEALAMRFEFSLQGITETEEHK